MTPLAPVPPPVPPVPLTQEHVFMSEEENRRCEDAYQDEQAERYYREHVEGDTA